MAFTQTQIDAAEAVYASMARSLQAGDKSISYEDVAAQERRLAYMKSHMTDADQTIVRQVLIRPSSGY
jgi:hypothetical protein